MSDPGDQIRFHILLVEDNQPDALVVRQALRMQGWDASIHEITDAEAACGYIGRIGRDADAPLPDIMIVDLSLPRGDGLEVVRAFRDRQECASTPVIVMTSSESPEAKSAAARLGNIRYFRKPLDLDSFLAIGALAREMLSHGSWAGSP